MDIYLSIKRSAKPTHSCSRHSRLTDRIDDLIHLSYGHLIHLLVQLIEVRADLFVVVGIVFVVTFVEHGEDRLTDLEVRWMGFNVKFQCFNNSFQGNITQKFWVMLP